MSIINRHQAIDALQFAIHQLTTLNYPSMILPYLKGRSVEPVRARRAAALGQWPIERDDFEVRVVQGYSELAPGSVRQLVAATGIGKSTRMPYLIAIGKSVSGLILSPDNTLAFSTFTYVNGKIKSEWGGGVNVSVLRSSHSVNPLSSPALYYSSVADFLGRLCANPNLLRDLGIEFIYLDESHEKNPEYYVMRLLVANEWFPNQKVFYGTATEGSDLNMESDNSMKTVIVRPEVQFNVTTPGTLSSNSPMHYTRIADRTMIFLALDSEIDNLYAYYDSHDVPVFKIRAGDSSRVYVNLKHFLIEQSLCVVLASHVFQTGHTFNIDTLIDTGYKRSVVIDYGAPSFAIQRVKETLADRVQRCGRVGRFKRGRAFHPDFDVAPSEPELTEYTSFYVYLWSIVLGLDIRDELISRFSALTGDMSILSAALLLNSRVPAFLLLPYVTGDGFYRGFAKTMNCITFSDVLVESRESNQEKMDSWDEFNTGSVPWAQKPLVFKTKIPFPRELSIIPYYFWACFNGEVEPFKLAGSNQSVITAIGTPVRPASIASTRLPSPKLPPPYASEVFSSPRPAYSIADIQDNYSVRNTMADVGGMVSSMDNVKFQHSSRVSVVPDDAGVKEKVRHWRKSISSSSSSRDDIELRQVDPVKYSKFKLYPMDIEIRRAYLENETVGAKDYTYMSRMLSGKEVFSALSSHSDRNRQLQAKYFLALLRIHNVAVVKTLQLAAGDTGFVGSIHKFMNGGINTHTDDRDTASRLLKVCVAEHYYVGMDKRALKGSSDISIASVDPAALQRAQIMLSFGSTDVPELIALYQTQHYDLIDHTSYAYGNAWFSGSYMFSARHLFESDDGVVKLNDSHICLDEIYPDLLDQDLVIFDVNDSSPSTLLFRCPEHNELVYVVGSNSEYKPVQIIGVFSIKVENTDVYVTANMPSGYSGSIIVSVKDGAILGVYTGYIGRVGVIEYSLLVTFPSEFYNV